MTPDRSSASRSSLLNPHSLILMSLTIDPTTGTHLIGRTPCRDLVASYMKRHPDKISFAANPAEGFDRAAKQIADEHSIPLDSARRNLRRKIRGK